MTLIAAFAGVIALGLLRLALRCRLNFGGQIIIEVRNIASALPDLTMRPKVGPRKMLSRLAFFRFVLFSQLSRVILNQFEGAEVNFERVLRLCRAVSHGLQLRDSKALMRYDPARLGRTRFRLIRCDLSRHSNQRAETGPVHPEEAGRREPFS